MVKKKRKEPKPLLASKRIPSLKVNTGSTENPSKWIPINRPVPLPEAVKKVLNKLDRAGHLVYLVGGCVRDFFLNRSTKDFDIATSATPDEICALFPDAITVGKAFGVIRLSDTLEIATFREDLEYIDHRHPKFIKFSGAVEDSKRRDFTINALYFDPKTGKILDPTGGLQDLERKILRAIGTPGNRFKEDALRLLRAIRFSAQFQFEIDPATAEAIHAKARLIHHVSAERIREELTLMWQGPHPARALELLSKLGLLKQVLPEVDAFRGVKQSRLFHPEGDVWNHTLRAMAFMGKHFPLRSEILSWAILLHDVGKPIAGARCGGKNFTGHELDGMKIAHLMGERFKMSREQMAGISELIENHSKFREVFQMREATLERFIRLPRFEELLHLHQADVCAADGNLAYYEFCKFRYNQVKQMPESSVLKLVDGKDLIQLGMKPGPEFSEIIRTIEDLALEKKIHSKEEALHYILKHFVR